MYRGTFPDANKLEPEQMVAIMKLTEYWRMADLFKKMQELLVDVISIGTYEYRKRMHRLSPVYFSLALRSRRRGKTH
jgi:hypothetical protein